MAGSFSLLPAIHPISSSPPSRHRVARLPRMHAAFLSSGISSAAATVSLRLWACAVYGFSHTFPCRRDETTLNITAAPLGSVGRAWGEEEGGRRRIRRRRTAAKSADSTEAQVGASLGDEGAEEEGKEEDGERSRRDVLQEAIVRIAEADIEETAVKYGLEEELFAEVDFARINAFSESAFGGNPAAVCYMPYGRGEEWMLAVAREFNLSETAFLVRRRIKQQPLVGPSGNRGGKGKGKGMQPLGMGAIRGNEFELRWFTPTMEVKLCGHATLASAHLLFSTGLVTEDEVVFHTLSGALRARKVSDPHSPLLPRPPQDISTEAKKKGKLQAWVGGASEGQGPGGEGPPQPPPPPPPTEERRPIGRGLVELDFPQSEVVEVSQSAWGEVEAALGLREGTALWIGRTSLLDILVEVESPEVVDEMQPVFPLVAQLQCRGVIVTASCAGEEEEGGQISTSSKWGHDFSPDFVSRFFAPQAGIDEDPVTGSAHCALGPFWAERLGKSTLRAFQASERGGKLVVRVDSWTKRVYLQGCAVSVMAGVLLNTTISASLKASQSSSTASLSSSPLPI